MPRWLKAIVAIALLAVLFMGIDWGQLPARLSRFGWMTVAIVLVSIAGQFIASAWKWQCSLRLHDMPLRFLYVLKVFCIGFFFNNFLPSAIGGDAYRVYRTMPFASDRLRALSAVIVERVVGLSAMLALGFLGALTLMNSSTLARTYLALTSTGLVVGIVTLLAVYLGWFKFITQRLRRFGWFSAVEASAQSVLRMRSEWIGLLMASALFQMLVAVILYALFGAVGVSFNIAQCMLVATAAGLASSVPVSINGIGVVEGTIAGAAVALGAEFEPALVAAVTLRILVLPANAVCGLVYLFDRKHAASADFAPQKNSG